MDTRTEDLRVELAFLRDSVVEAASQRKSSIVESGLDTYEALVSTFIDVLREFDSPYDRDKALAEIHRVGGGWSEIDWIRDDFREIADAALVSKNLSVILPVIYFPVRVSGLAYQRREFFIFSQFLNWLPFLYRTANEELADEDAANVQRSQASVFEIVRDRLSGYAHDLASYRIGADISRSQDPTEISQSCDFAREVFATFNRLLKSTYDLRRARDLQQFASEFQDIYRHEQDHGALAEALQHGDAAELSPETARNRCYRDLVQLRQIIFLGLDAWLLRDYDRKQLTVSEASELRSSLFVPGALPELWRLYLAVRSERYDRELDWTWWETNEHKGRGAYVGIDFSGLVLRAILLRMLATASTMTRDRVMQQPLDLSRDLDHLVGTGSGSILVSLNNIVESPELRELEAFEPHVADWLRDRFLALAEEQAEHERIRVADAPLSVARVQALKQELVQGLHEAGYLRRLVSLRGNYELVTDPPPDLDVLSIHLLERKDMFIDDTRIFAGFWAKDLGRSLARGEDERLIAQIASAVPSLSSEPIDPKSVLTHVEQAVDGGPELQDPVIILAGSLAAGWALAESSRFEYARHLVSEQVPQPTAFLGELPIYQVHTDKEHLAIVADLKQLGVWRQYIPKLEPGSELLDGFIRFELEDFSEITARTLLVETQPDLFLRDASTGAERSLEERMAELRRRLRILILEQFEFDMTNPGAARVIPLSD